MGSVPQTKPPLGMLPWWQMPPPFGLDSVEVWRDGGQHTRVIRKNSLHPATNVYGLWWREPRQVEEVSHAIN